MSNIEIIQELRWLNGKFDGEDICAMNLAYDVAHKYSSCRLCGVGKGVGALIVRNGIILSFGYNGMVAGIRPCTAETCIRLTREPTYGTGRDECYGDCAEKRAFLNAYRTGTDITGAKIYITKSPCISCCKLILNLGLREVIFDEVYAESEFSFELLDMASVPWRKINGFTRADH